MSEINATNRPSPLVSTILALDEHFSNLQRLASRIEDIDLKSNFDFEQMERLIPHFAETGLAVSESISKFVVVLNEAREKAEAAAQKVAEKADQLKMRKEDVQEKMARFDILNEKVKKLNQSLTQFRRPVGETLSEPELVELKTRLGEIGKQLESLIQEAHLLKKVGHESKIKTLEQNAESMRQSLVAVNQKISDLMSPHPTSLH